LNNFFFCLTFFQNGTREKGIRIEKAVKKCNNNDNAILAWKLTAEIFQLKKIATGWRRTTHSNETEASTVIIRYPLHNKSP